MKPLTGEERAWQLLWEAKFAIDKMTSLGEQLDHNRIWDLERLVREARDVSARIQARKWQEQSIAEHGSHMTFGCGDIGSCCEDMVYHANRLQRVITCEFNDRTLVARPGMTPEQVYKEGWQ